MGEALVDAFQHMTLNDTAKAEAVESDLKKTFPWMAAVDLDSPENLTETIRERFMQRSSADERDLAEMAADHLITKFSILAKVNQLDRDQYTVLGKALNHLFKWLDEGEEKKEEDKGE
jgi:hypothetical protein